MANNAIGTTPIVRISQLQEETERTMSSYPGNTWFTVVNADIMKTKRLSLDSLLKFVAAYLTPAEEINYFTIDTLGGLTANSLNTLDVYLGNTFTISDESTYNHANAGFDHANTGVVRSTAAFVKANLAFYSAEAGFINSNSAFDKANSAFDKANSLITVTSSGGIRLNNSLSATSVGLGGSILITDNLTYDIATTANTKAYTKFALNVSGGITGGGEIELGQQLTVSGSSIFVKANGAYDTANSAMVRPEINYVTSNGVIAYSNNRYVILGNNLELTLQDNPKFNTFVYITNMSASENNVIKVSNTQRIHGLSAGESLRLNISNVSVTMCYVDSVRGWVIV